MTGSYLEITPRTITAHPSGTTVQRVEAKNYYVSDWSLVRIGDWSVGFFIFIGVYITLGNQSFFFFGKPPQYVTKPMLRWNRYVVEPCFGVIASTTLYLLILTLRTLWT